jgi:hypothetical protein
MRYLFIQLFLGLFLLPLQAQTDDRIYEKVDQEPIFGNCSKKDAKETKACSDQTLMLFMTRNLVSVLWYAKTAPPPITNW